MKVTHAKGTIRTENGVEITHRLAVHTLDNAERPGRFVCQGFGVLGEVNGPATGSVSYEIRHEAGAVVADPHRRDDRSRDYKVEYVVYRDGEFLVRCHGPKSAYDRLKRHGVRIGSAGDLEASQSR